MRVFLPSLLALLVGCGNAAPGVDYTPTQQGSTPTVNYPAGPYGWAEGSVMENLIVSGKKDPNGMNGTAKYAELKMQEISLADYFNTSNVKYIFLSGEAVWCKPCNEEQAEIPALQQKWEPQGVQILEALIETRTPGVPSTEADINSWANLHKLHVAITIDPSDRIHQYIGEAAYPLNMIIRTSDMKILFAQTGVPRSVDALLADFVE